MLLPFFSFSNMEKQIFDLYIQGSNKQKIFLNNCNGLTHQLFQKISLLYSRFLKKGYLNHEWDLNEYNRKF